MASSFSQDARDTERNTFLLVFAVQGNASTRFIRNFRARRPVSAGPTARFVPGLSSWNPAIAWWPAEMAPSVGTINQTVAGGKQNVCHVWSRGSGPDSTHGPDFQGTRLVRFSPVSKAMRSCGMTRPRPLRHGRDRLCQDNKVMKCDKNEACRCLRPPASAASKTPKSGAGASRCGPCRRWSCNSTARHTAAQRTAGAHATLSDHSGTPTASR